METVKFRRLARSLAGPGLALAALTGSTRGEAQPVERSLLLGGPAPAERRKVPADPRLPLGSDFHARPRPVTTAHACSASRPVCVHATGRVAPSRIPEAVAALEDAYTRVVGVLDLPAPLDDGSEGGTGGLDLYLVAPDTLTPSFERLRVTSTARRFGGFDASAGFCTAMDDGGILLERASTLCVGEAVALRLDPAETPHLRRAFATELWWLSGLPTSFDFEAIDWVQRRPTRALAGRTLSAASEGSALLFEYLEAKLGAGAPGELSTALLAASAQTTGADAKSWHNEPDVFDVLRHTLGESEQRMARLLADFAVTRSFLGDREDGLHLPELAWAGRFGAPIFDWVIPYAKLPKRVRVTPPEPTGAVLVWLDLAGAPAGVPLGFQAEWEPPAEFAWTLVRVGADGSELGRLEVPFQQRETQAEARLVDLGGARAVLAVGAHIERVDVDQPFDPDVAPFEPHGALVYLVEL